MLKVAFLALPLLVGCATTPAQMYFGRPPIRAAEYNPRSYYSAQNCPECKTDAQTRAEDDAARYQMAAELRDREAKQGQTVRQLSVHQCDGLLRAIPGHTHSQAVQPQHTSQEDYCVSQNLATQGNANNVYPGMLPEGGSAVSMGNGRWWVSW